MCLRPWWIGSLFVRVLKKKKSGCPKNGALRNTKENLFKAKLKAHVSDSTFDGENWWILISDVLFDTGKQLYVYETLVNLTISVPATKSWYSRSLNVFSGFKRWSSRTCAVPSLSSHRLLLLPFDSVCVCMWHTPYSLQWFDTHDLLWI